LSRFFQHIREFIELFRLCGLDFALLLYCASGAAQVGAEKTQSQPALAFAQDALMDAVCRWFDLEY